jgi:hypothetical protein
MGLEFPLQPQVDEETVLTVHCLHLEEPCQRSGTDLE